jgi:hypothetical protein
LACADARNIGGGKLRADAHPAVGGDGMCVAFRTMPQAKGTNMKMTVVLALGVAAAALIAAAMRDPKPASHAAPSATAEQAATAEPTTEATEATQGSELVEGKVLEVIEVPNYT